MIVGFFLYRVARRLFKPHSGDYVKWLRSKGVIVGENVHFRNPEHTIVDITRPELVKFGSNLDINDNFTVLTHDFASFVFRNKYHDFVNSSGRVDIGNNIVFGRNVTIMKGVSIGDNCVVGLGAVVTKPMPSNSVIAGCPARVICSLDDYYASRKKKQIVEALEFAASLKEIKIERMTEEWVLFLSEDDYEKSMIIRNEVHKRTLKEEYPFDMLKHRPYMSFKDFVTAVNTYKKQK